jgi:subtilisin-like proprotein convertase family protein
MRRAIAPALVVALACLSLSATSPLPVRAAYSIGISTTDVPIPDDAYDGTETSMASSLINIVAPGGHQIVDISLYLKIQHPWVGDLTIKLKSPAGTVLTILERPKGNGTENPPGDNGTDADTDSSNLSASTSIAFNDIYVNDAESMGGLLGDADTVCEHDSTCIFSPNPDTATSQADFSAAFDGQSVAGDWTLFIGDSDATAGSGYLSEWSISIQHRRPLEDCLTPPFPDVPTTNPFCREIQWMRDEGIATGFGDGTYRPASSVTRQAMSAFIYRASSNGAPPANCSGPPFLDVPVDHPFCKEIQWMKQQSISTGFDDGTYRPGISVTRQAMSAFIRRTAAGPQPSCMLEPFTDVPTEHFFCPDISWMKDYGVSTGFGDGTYRPANAVTRQAMSAFIYRLTLILP